MIWCLIISIILFFSYNLDAIDAFLCKIFTSYTAQIEFLFLHHHLTQIEIGHTVRAGYEHCMFNAIEASSLYAILAAHIF